MPSSSSGKPPPRRAPPGSRPNRERRVRVPAPARSGASRAPEPEAAARVRIRLIAVGTRMPEWVDQGCEEYLRRLRSSMPVTLQEIPVARRGASATPAQAIASETRALLATLDKDEMVVALDERGKQWTTLEL